MQHYDRSTIREVPIRSTVIDADQNNTALLQQAIVDGTVGTRFKTRSGK